MQVAYTTSLQHLKSHTRFDVDLLSNEKATYLGLVDILFAYSYNHRVFEGENTVESAWCIGKLCSSMACLEVRKN